MPQRTLLTTTAAVGALCFLTEGVLELGHEQGQPLTGVLDHLIELLFAGGLLLTLAGVASLHERTQPAAGRLGDLGLKVAGAGQGVLGLVALASAARGHDVFGPVFAVALLAWTGGTVVAAFAAVRSGAGRAMALLPAALVASFAAGPGGVVLLGAAWLVVLRPLGAAARPSVLSLVPSRR